MPQVLIAMNNEELRGEVKQIVDQAPELENLKCQRVSEFATAKEAIEDNKDIVLVVIDYDINTERGVIRCDVDNKPVALASDLANDETGPKFLILGPITKISDIQKISLLNNAETIDSQQLFLPDSESNKSFVLLKIISMIGNFEGQSSQQDLKGLIELELDNDCMVHCRTGVVTDDGYYVNRSNESFQFDSSIWDDLELGSKTLANMNLPADNFISHYEMIGKKTRQILNFNEVNKRAIINLISKVGSVDNVWIRFHVPYRDMPSIPFEAVLQCDGFEEQNSKQCSSFQLAHSPVYRIVSKSIGSEIKLRLPILSGLKKSSIPKINCLIIDASTSGTVDTSKDKELPDSLDKIEHYGLTEIEKVMEIFTEMKDKGIVRKIDTVKFDTDEELDDPILTLSEKFESEQWDIIHFSGHSFFRAGKKGKPDKGYVFLPGKQVAKPVGIKMVANWFESANLVYLSSCQSAEPAFVNALAERGIPTIIGFRWNVSGRGAAQFAGLFYYNLFHGDRIGDIEPAFVEAQRSLMDPSEYPLPDAFQKNQIWADPDERAWASPMLVMQNV